MEGAWKAAGATEGDAILAGGYGQAEAEVWVEAGTAASGRDDDDDKAATRAASAAVLEALRESSVGKGAGEREKMARSEFVGFMRRLAGGQVELEGNTVGC